MDSETKKIPDHIGIIVDGNRRWAKEKGLPASEGHRRGLEKVKKTIKWCKEKGVKTLTLFVFSTENWKRPQKEVNYLMSLIKEALAENLIKKLHSENIRVRIIGQKEKLAKLIREKVEKAENLTKNNKEMNLNFALSYGGRAEIIDALKNIIQKKIKPEKINENIVSENLWTSDVDLIIRTGKEQRLSNFLIWQAAYSELYFCPKYWPEFTEKDLDLALFEYEKRKRRFGK